MRGSRASDAGARPRAGGQGGPRVPGVDLQQSGPPRRAAPARRTPGRAPATVTGGWSAALASPIVPTVFFAFCYLFAPALCCLRSRLMTSRGISLRP